MGGFDSLARLDVTVRPLTIKPPHGHRRSQFSATMTATVRTLASELGHLDAKRIVLEVDLREQDIRLDGLPRSNASPTSPAVAIAFESRFGPLRYATCEFTHWEDNLRAIALAMEALRAVDRYGVSKRGEQYQGWKQLPTSTDPADSLMTSDQAAEAIHGYVDDVYDIEDIADDGPHQKEAIREAIRRTHPDVGGDADDFRRVQRAKELLGG